MVAGVSTDPQSLSKMNLHRPWRTTI